MKLWKGRFSKEATSSADEFNASIGFDRRLYKQDITASIVHAKMLGYQGIITAEESSLIVNTLKEILTDIENGNIEFSIENEDIHMNIEMANLGIDPETEGARQAPMGWFSMVRTER